VNGDGRPTAEDVVVGIDFGTLSGRAVVVRVSDGDELGTAVNEYAHGVIDLSGVGALVYCLEKADMPDHATPDDIR
jgi:ribulose kinase